MEKYFQKESLSRMKGFLHLGLLRICVASIDRVLWSYGFT